MNHEASDMYVDFYKTYDYTVSAAKSLYFQGGVETNLLIYLRNGIFTFFDMILNKTISLKIFNQKLSVKHKIECYQLPHC